MNLGSAILNLLRIGMGFRGGDVPGAFFFSLDCSLLGLGLRRGSGRRGGFLLLEFRHEAGEPGQKEVLNSALSMSRRAWRPPSSMRASNLPLLVRTALALSFSCFGAGCLSERKRMAKRSLVSEPANSSPATILSARLRIAASLRSSAS